MGADPVGVAVLDQVRRLVDDLRRAGVPTGLTGLVEACTALGHVDLGAREHVRLALRCTLVKRAEDEAVFDALFDARFAPRARRRHRSWAATTSLIGSSPRSPTTTSTKMR